MWRSAQRMTGRRLEHERAADAASLAEVERSLRQRIKVLEERDARLAAAEAMLVRREERSAAGGGAATAAAQEDAQASAAEQLQQRKLPRVGSKLPDFSGEEWTAAAVRQRRGTLAQRLRDLRQALEGLASAPVQQPQQKAAVEGAAG